MMMMMMMMMLVSRDRVLDFREQVQPIACGREAVLAQP
jgi:hypothetical protein